MGFACNIGAKYDPCVHPSGCFEVDLSQLKSILEEDKLKDRNVVAVFIAGAMLSGKRFLLNYFLKYLYNGQVSGGKLFLLCRTENIKLLLLVFAVQKE